MMQGRGETARNNVRAHNRRVEAPPETRGQTLSLVAMVMAEYAGSLLLVFLFSQ